MTSQQRRDGWTVRPSSPQIRSSTRWQPCSTNFSTPIDSLLTLGLSTSEGKPPFKIYGDSTPQKYVVNGEIQVVPHDRCPHCYGVWDFKLNHLSCTECGATMGQEVKLLLDTDVCPFCEEGKVSLTAPVCEKCGHQIDPSVVVWG